MDFHKKIFVVPFLPEISMAEGQRMWHEEHGPIWVRTPHLRGYVQNRPVPEWWGRIPALACAEDYFDSREAEQQMLETDYYRDTVLPDEERMFRRSGAWVSTVTKEELLQEGSRSAFRVLAFGAPRPAEEHLEDAGRVELMHVRRAPPLCPCAHVVSAWAADLDHAERLSRWLGGFAFVAAPESLMPPPLTPGEAAGPGGH